MARFSFKLLAVLAAVVVAHAAGPAKPGTSCTEFDNDICKDVGDGVFFENPSDCGSPWCHTTYVVCYNGSPTVQSCPDDTVWSQHKSVCINKPDAPGGCPAMCGLLNGTMCTGVADGVLKTNPTDCEENNRVNSFLYCLGDMPIVTECPADAYWNQTALQCYKAGNMVAIVAPKVPGYKAVIAKLEEVVAPAPAPVEAVIEAAPAPNVSEPIEEVVEAPAPVEAVPTGCSGPGCDDEIAETTETAYAPAPGPSVSYDPMNFTFSVTGKEILELSESEVEDAWLNATGMTVDAAAAANNHKLTMMVGLADFEYMLDDEIKQELNDALRYLTVETLKSHDITTDDVVVENIEGAISTASTQLAQGEDVTATIVVTPNYEEQAQFQELVAAMPVTYDRSVLMLTNSTANSLSLSPEVADYLREHTPVVTDWMATQDVTITHTMGEEAQKKIEMAVEEGVLAKELSNVLGESVMIEKAEAQIAAEEEGTREIVIESEDNAAASCGGLATALAGALVTLALVL